MKSILLLALVSCAVFSADARTMKKRQLSPAAAAANAVTAMVANVGNTLTSIPSAITTRSVAMVRWAGNLQYTVKFSHGKPILSYSNSDGGAVAVAQRDLALVGANANVNLTYNGQQVGIVYLSTISTSPIAATAKLYSGSANFAQQTVTKGLNVALVLAFITPGNSAESTSNEISYPFTSSTISYNAQDSSIETCS